MNIPRHYRILAMVVAVGLGCVFILAAAYGAVYSPRFRHEIYGWRFSPLYLIGTLLSWGVALAIGMSAGAGEGPPGP